MNARSFAIALFVALILLLGGATFVEQGHGAAYAAQHIYHTWWFFGMWALLVAASVLVMLHRHLQKRPAVFGLHLSFILILAGAAVTFLTSKEGMIHLRKGMAEHAFFEENTQGNVALPFTITLQQFEISYYPGTQAPSDFISHVTIVDTLHHASEQATISMNHIHVAQGYRLCQSAFDADHEGTTLTVSYDPWGIGLSYLGYAMLFLSMVAVLWSRKEEFRTLLHHPSIQGGTLALAMFAILSPTPSQARSIPTIGAEKAQQLSRMQVVYNDRIAPLNTQALDFLQKIYGKRTYKELSAEQVVYGWIARPDVWKEEKMLKVKDKTLRTRLGMDDAEPYASLASLFDERGNYKLAPLLGNATYRQAKALQELDEKVGLILMLTGGTLITPLPKGTPPLSESDIQMELAYNAIPFSKILFIFCLTIGFLSFILLIARLQRPHSAHTLQTALDLLLWLAFLFNLSGYALRWYISGRMPLGNGYETMLFLSLLLQAVALLLHRRFLFTLPFGFLLSGFTLLVAHLAQISPQITSLMPVLQSPILSSHVSAIMVAYALLAFIMLNGLMACLLAKTGREGNHTTTIEQLTVLSRLMLYPAVFLLGIGIFLGAVWANVSWGRYWSWDPKEVWALITFMVYGAAFHKEIRLFRRPISFHAYMAAAFLVVVMTYFGVNYLLGGMHSYA